MKNMNGKSVNQEKTQIINRSLVLNLIRREGICSRAQLAQLSGLMQTTITNIISEFINCGLIIETGLMSGSRGRRSIKLQFNDEAYRVIGIRMTRRAFYVALFGLSGKIYNINEYRISPNEDVNTVITRIRTTVEVFCKNSDYTILAAAMALPGPYCTDKDRLLFVTELEGWQDFSIKAVLTKGLEIPLYIINDADAGALAQIWCRRGMKTKNLIYVLAGQGIGCGIIENSKLFLGENGIAGEIGHTSINFEGPLCKCGNCGCLEKYCSYLVLCDNIKKRLSDGQKSILSGRDLTIQEISEAIKSGDEVAKSEYIKVCSLLSVGIINMINQFNPSLVVVGDELAEIAPELLLSLIQKKLFQCINPLILNSLTVEINPLKKSSCLLGAGAFAALNVFEDPIGLINRNTKEARN